MSFRKRARVALVTGLVAGGLALTACSPGSLGSSTTSAPAGGSESAPAANVTITYLVDNSDQATKPAQSLVDAFNATNSGVTVKLETRAQGTDGDNVVKTKLATGDTFARWDGTARTPVRGTHLLRVAPSATDPGMTAEFTID